MKVRSEERNGHRQEPDTCAQRTIVTKAGCAATLTLTEVERPEPILDVS